MLSSCACKPMNCRLIGTSKSTVGVGFAAGFARRGSLQSRDCNACASSSSPPSPAPPSPSPAARKSRLTPPLKLPAKLLTLRPTLRLLLLTPALRLRKPPLTRALPRRCNPRPQGQVTDRKGRGLHRPRPFSRVQRESGLWVCCGAVVAGLHHPPTPSSEEEGELNAKKPPPLHRRGLGVVRALRRGASTNSARRNRRNSQLVALSPSKGVSAAKPRPSGWGHRQPSGNLRRPPRQCARSCRLAPCGFPARQRRSQAQGGAHRACG